ncbi:MAG: hypothetical protein ABSG72_05300 [Candidatus Sulfotelmatobacter sp.]|jgi:hypothetical protein
MIQVNIENGQITPAGSTLSANTPFQWLNNTPNDVELSNCGNWANKDTYDVPGNGGTADASVLPVPNLQGGAFTDPAWNTPGMPHIVVTPWPVTKKEVA